MLAWLALLGSAELLLAQTTTTTTTTGSSPWVNVVQELETQFTGPIARGLSLIAVVIGGPHVSPSVKADRKRAMAGIIFGLGMAMGRSQLSGLALPMRGGMVWGAYPTLSKPLTIMGVERRWFLLSATLGLAMWNAINSLVTGGMIFVVLYVAGWLAWKKDPKHAEHPQGLGGASRPATTPASGKLGPGPFGSDHDRQGAPRPRL